MNVYDDNGNPSYLAMVAMRAPKKPGYLADPVQYQMQTPQSAYSPGTPPIAPYSTPRRGYCPGCRY